MSRWTSASLYLRPIKRLVAKRVFSGLTTAWRFADIPTSRSPSCAKATTDGVVLVPRFQKQILDLEIRQERDGSNVPSEFSIILGVLPSKTATAELVVPGSVVQQQNFGHLLKSKLLTQIYTNNLTLHFFFSAGGLEPRER